MNLSKILQSDTFSYWFKPFFILLYMLLILWAPFIAGGILKAIFKDMPTDTNLLHWLLPLTGVALMVPAGLPTKLKLIFAPLYYIVMATCFPLIGILLACLMGNCI